MRGGYSAVQYCAVLYDAIRDVSSHTVKRAKLAVLLLLCLQTRNCPAPCRHNIQRLKVATNWIPAMWGYFTELKAWVR